MMFVYALRDRMNQALSNFDVEVRANRDRAYIDINDENPYEIMDKLLNISGILSMSPVVKIAKSDDAMKETGLKFAKCIESGHSYKIEDKRADKNNHIDTFGIQE